jgi:hypothetical protein
LVAEQPELLNRRILFATAGLVAAASVGLMNNFSTLMLGASLIGAPVLWPVVFIVAPIVATVALRLYSRAAWAWLLVAGALLAIPAAVASQANRPPTFGDQVVALTGLMSPTLLLLGVLAAAAWVGRAGYRGLGAVLASLTIAIPTLGQFLLPQASRGIFTAIALCGAVGAVSMLRFLRGQEESRPTWRVVIVGSVASVLPVLTGLFGDWFVIPGLVLMLAVAVVGGVRPTIGAVIIALVGASTLTTVVYLAFLVNAGAIVMVALIAGFLVGLVGAASRYRVEISVAGLVLLAILTFAGMTQQGLPYVGYGAPMAFLLVAAIVAKTGAVADLLRATATGPIFIGVIAPLLNNAFFALQIQLDKGSLTSLVETLRGWTITYTAMLIVAAALLLLLKRLTAQPKSRVDVSEGTV